MTPLRFLFSVFFLFGSLLLSATWWSTLLPAYIPIPNVALMLIVFFGLKTKHSGAHQFSIQHQNANPIVLILLGCILGYFTDLFSFTPFGLQPLLLSLIVMLLWALSTKLLVRGILFLVVITLLVSLVYYAAFLGLRVWMNPKLEAAHVRWVLLPALSTTVVSPFVFLLLRKMDSPRLKKDKSLGLVLP